MYNNLSEEQWRYQTGASSQYVRPELLRVVEREETKRLSNMITPTSGRNRDNIVSHTFKVVKTIVYAIVTGFVSRLY